jgi:hypothetical protein
VRKLKKCDSWVHRAWKARFGAVIRDSTRREAGGS